MANKDRKYFVYKHVNKINNKVYIGITCKASPELRWGKNGSNYYLQVFGKAIEKYGWDNFEHIILFEGIGENEAKRIEKELIKEQKEKYGVNSCYNISAGGEGGLNTYKIYCNETGEVFNSAEEVINKQKHYKTTTPNDIMLCCKFYKEYIKMPWINKNYHYQFLKKNNYTIEELEEKYKKNKDRLDKRHMKSIEKKENKRKEWIKNNMEKYKDDKSRKQCCVCGKFFKAKTNRRKYCGKCAKEMARKQSRERQREKRKLEKS